MRLRQLLFLISIVVFCASLFVAMPTDLRAEESLRAEPVENCDAYYEKAKKYATEAESIKIEGLGSMGRAAEKGGVSGQAGAYANLYQACILRQAQKEKTP